MVSGYTEPTKLQVEGTCSGQYSSTETICHFPKLRPLMKNSTHTHTHTRI